MTIPPCFKICSLYLFPPPKRRCHRFELKPPPDYASTATETGTTRAPSSGRRRPLSTRRVVRKHCLGPQDGPDHPVLASLPTTPGLPSPGSSAHRAADPPPRLACLQPARPP